MLPSKGVSRQGKEPNKRNDKKLDDEEEEEKRKKRIHWSLFKIIRNSPSSLAELTYPRSERLDTLLKMKERQREREGVKNK